MWYMIIFLWQVIKQDPWCCYMCTADPKHGFLVRRDNWTECLLKFFADDREAEYKPFQMYPAMSVAERRPIRVLSLFDGVGTGNYTIIFVSYSLLEKFGWQGLVKKSGFHVQVLENLCTETSIQDVTRFACTTGNKSAWQYHFSVLAWTIDIHANKLGNSRCCTTQTPSTAGRNLLLPRMFAGNFLKLPSQGKQTSRLEYPARVMQSVRCVKWLSRGGS